MDLTQQWVKMDASRRSLFKDVAFELVEHWAGDTESPWQHANPPRVPTAFDALLANGRDVKARRVVAFVVTAVAHIWLLWLLFNAFSHSIGEGQGQKRGDGITLIDLSGSISGGAPANPAVQVDVASPAPPVPATPVEASAPSVLKSEWQVSRLRAPASPIDVMPAAPALAAATGGSGSVSGIGAGVGGGGGQGYDPYAGAAPMWKHDTDQGLTQPQRQPQSTQGAVAGASPSQPAKSWRARVAGWLGFEGATANNAGIALDRAALDAALNTARRAAPGAIGTVRVMVQVSLAGNVIGVTVLGGSADPRGRDAMVAALLGRKLFAVAKGGQPSAEIELPEIRL